MSRPVGRAGERDERAIVGVAPDGVPGKIGRDFHCRITYTLADGATEASTASCSRKMDVLPYIARMDRYAKAGNLAAIYHDGEFIGTRTQYSMTGS